MSVNKATTNYQLNYVDSLLKISWSRYWKLFGGKEVTMVYTYQPHCISNTQSQKLKADRGILNGNFPELEVYVPAPHRHHSKLDKSIFLDDTETYLYQSYIGIILYKMYTLDGFI